MSPSHDRGAPRAIILAAGRGSRLRPLTDHIPKPLVEVGGHPLITYGLGSLRDARIEDVVISLHHLPEQVRTALGDGSRYGVRIRYSVEERLLDSGGGIRRAASLFARPIDGPIVVLNADVVSEIPLREVLDFHREREAMVTLVLRDDPRKEAYGVFAVDSRARIRRFLGRGARSELPEYMFASVQILSPAVLERMPDGPFSSMRGLYPELFDQGARFFGYVYEGPWCTADTREDLEAAERSLRRHGLPPYMEAERP